MATMLETIAQRVSVRTYSEQPVEREKRTALLEYLEDACTGPFGNRVRFTLVDASGYNPAEIKRLGTYGMIRGARLYLAGAVRKGNGAMEDFGYCMERAILKATELGLGTCWLGGSLDRSVFAEAIGLEPGDLIPAVTPLGYGLEEKRVFIKTARWYLRASGRKDFGQLFFEGGAGAPLDQGRAGAWARVLEAVRHGPSASNRQPWRLIREPAEDTWHLFLSEDPAYNAAFPDIRIQNLDMGIAMCHFETAARELNLPGGWTFRKPALDAGKWQYIASWTAG